MRSTLPIRSLFVLAILAISGAWLTSAAPKPARTPWTTSRVVGSPDPPRPFKVVRAFPNIQLKSPLLLARCPGSDRLYIGEQGGVLHSFRNKPDARAEVFFDLTKELKTLHLLPTAKEVEAVYGLVFHPDFEKNRACFVCYTLRSKKPGEENLADGSRVSRFTVTKTDPPRIDPASEEILLTFLQGGHNGGDLHFGPDRMLYISTGDATAPNPPDKFETGQDISDLLSSILRIDVDRKDPGKNYAVPKDNPFVTLKDARPEVWAYGFRNPWRMSFDRQTGELFVGDVGWELWEMVHRIEKGGNYGWAAMEGPQPIKPDKVGPTPIRPALIALPHTIACSVTGGYVYRGKKFPELRGAYIFGDWETRRLWAARFDGDRTKEMPELTRPAVRIVAFGEDNDGEVYFLDHDNGGIYTLERNTGEAKNNAFPKRLSDTGLFASVKDYTPAAGVVPFAPVAKRWQDEATAEHWVALPGTASATYHASPKPIPGMVNWHNFRMHFPKDAVLVKTLSLGGKRIETQILHFEGIDWNPYTFAWRDDQSDADLVHAEGDEREVRIGKQTRLWQFPSRTQCLSCHNSWAEYALAFQPEQLTHHWTAFTEAGLITRAGDGKAGGAWKLTDPTDSKKPIEDRARAYLHVNCGHCHTFGGGGAVDLKLQLPGPVKEMKVVDVRPTRGDFGLPDARIVKPGDACSSTLYYRMAKFGRDRMPHLGAELPDEAGMKLVAEWIESLKGTGKPEPVDMQGTPDTLLANTRSALSAARQLGNLKPSQRQALFTAAAKLSHGPVRDLFEGHLPQDETGPRKLGSNPRPRAILALKGQAERGEKLFWSETLKCGSCHKVAGRGIEVGPDLSTIGKQRSREDLLESILEPSRRIEPKYASYVAQTLDGRSFTGLLVRRDDKSVVLRDAQNKEVVLAAKNVEALRPSRTSLMPDGQMAGLTAQEAADLLEYLATRK